MQASEAVRSRSACALAPWQLKRACALLLTASCTKCPIARLAAVCGLSSSHFAHAFKASTGMPPHRWLLRQRLREACEIMERTGDSLASIALRCGFSDQSHFTRSFRSAIGRSPAAWRRARKSGISRAELSADALRDR